MKRVSACLLLLWTVLVITADPLHAQAQTCDNLHPLSGPFEYKNRGNRCEGLYVADVGGNTIDLVSLTAGRITYYLKPSLRLRVSTPPQGDPVHIRAVAIPPRTYYRMDAITDGKNALEWPANDVLVPQNLTEHRIGVFAWIGSQDHRVFIPVTVSTADSRPDSSSSYLLVRPSFDVEAVKWRSASLIKGECSNFGAWKDALQGTALAGQPIGISLASLTNRQCIQVAAQSGSSNDWSSLAIQVELGSQ